MRYIKTIFTSDDDRVIQLRGIRLDQRYRIVVLEENEDAWISEWWQSVNGNGKGEKYSFEKIYWEIDE